MTDKCMRDLAKEVKKGRDRWIRIETISGSEYVGIVDSYRIHSKKGLVQLKLRKVHASIASTGGTTYAPPRRKRGFVNPNKSKNSRRPSISVWSAYVPGIEILSYEWL